MGKVEKAIEIELSRILSKIHPKKLVGFILLVEDPSQEVGGLHIVRDRAAQGLGHLGLGIRPPPISKILKGSKAFHYINNRPLKLYKSV